MFRVFGAALLYWDAHDNGFLLLLLLDSPGLHGSGELDTITAVVAKLFGPEYQKKHASHIQDGKRSSTLPAMIHSCPTETSETTRSLGWTQIISGLLGGHTMCTLKWRVEGVCMHGRAV